MKYCKYAERFPIEVQGEMRSTIDGFLSAWDALCQQHHHDKDSLLEIMSQTRLIEAIERNLSRRGRPCLSK